MVTKPKSLHCPNCGGPVERRGFGHTLTITCPQCMAVIDASTPLFEVVQTFEKALTHQPLIPLGTRGNWDNTTWEVIGFQVRRVEGYADLFEWQEYLLFNPYRGFRYLTHYRGHWNFVTPLESVPMAAGPAHLHGNRSYKHFSSAGAITTFVLGEFPWRVRVGDRVNTSDYVAPPFLLSEESTDNETTWSEGVYVPGWTLWKAFNLPGTAPYAHGVYLNQPSPYGSVGPLWLRSLALIGITLALMAFFGVFSKRETVLELQRSFAANATTEPSFVSQAFNLTGRQATVEVSTRTDLDNNWAYFGYALINEDTGVAYDFGRELSYYHGADSDGAWSEGGASDSVILPSVPPGRYYLRVEPQVSDVTPPSQPIRVDIRLRHDVPTYTWFLLVIVLLIIPPVLRSIQAANFERLRWAESDHAPSLSTSEDEEDDE